MEMPMFHHVGEVYVAGNWQQDTLLRLPHTLVKTNPDRFVRWGAPDQSASTFQSAPTLIYLCTAVPHLHSCPCQTPNPSFPSEPVSVRGCNKALEPEICHFRKQVQ